MNKLLFFKIPSCPFCRQAEKFLAELMEENEQYKAIPIQVIDETSDRRLDASYDYYYVPAFFLGDKKLHEGVPSKNAIKRVLDEALKQA